MKYKTNYQFISNTCLASLIYLSCNILFDNPFIFSSMSDLSFFNLISNIHKINFKNFKIAPIYKNYMHTANTIIAYNNLHIDIKKYINIENDLFLINNSKFINIPKNIDNNIQIVFDKFLDVVYTHNEFNKKNVNRLTRYIFKFNKTKPILFIYEPITYTENKYLKLFMKMDNVLIVNNSYFLQKYLYYLQQINYFEKFNTADNDDYETMYYNNTLIQELIERKYIYKI